MNDRQIPGHHVPLIDRYVVCKGLVFGPCKGTKLFENYDTIFTFRDGPSSLITSMVWPLSIKSPRV